GRGAVRSRRHAGTRAPRPLPRSHDLRAPRAAARRRRAGRRLHLQRVLRRRPGSPAPRAPRPRRRARRARQPLRRDARARTPRTPFLLRRSGVARGCRRRARGRTHGDRTRTRSARVRRRAFPGTAASLAACSAPRLRDLGGQTSPTQAAYVPGVAAIVRTYGGHVPSLRAADAIGSLCTACVVRVERRGEADTFALGTLCPDPDAGPDAPCTPDSLFDLASLTKLATTALALSFVRERMLDLAMPFRELVPDFRGGRKDDVTLR